MLVYASGAALVLSREASFIDGTLEVRRFAIRRYADKHKGGLFKKTCRTLRRQVTETREE